MDVAECGYDMAGNNEAVSCVKHKLGNLLY
jgi:hypothetical protein